MTALYSAVPVSVLEEAAALRPEQTALDISIDGCGK